MTLDPAVPAWRAPVEYRDVESLDGPLMVVRGVAGVGWDEYVDVVTDAGERRHGVVIDVHDDLAVVQVFEGTGGLGTHAVRAAFTGRPMSIPLTEDWLGRVCNGRGEPLDGGPPVLGTRREPVTGFALNPARREPPADPIVTGVSVIDLLMTLVRGQKLPIFSIGGLPHLELAVQIAASAHVERTAGEGASGDRGDEAFRVVFAAMGVTHAEAALVRDGLQERAEAGDLVLFLNTADDPAVERILTPRLALTVAEHLAFDRGQHVLVLMADMTNYCEAVREVASSRGEVPTRRGYPGYLYSDLASLYERCGRVRGRPGSLTLMPVLTMPGGDITHPVPDLTGYITEGQVVLSRDFAMRGIYPPVDVLTSLSRLMRHGVGAGRTRDDHPTAAAQAQALLARARAAGELAELLGEEALSPRERLTVAFAAAFTRDVMAQRMDESRAMADTLDRTWRALGALPARELTMVPREIVEAHYRPIAPGASDESEEPAAPPAAAPQAGPGAGPEAHAALPAPPGDAP